MDIVYTIVCLAILGSMSLLLYRGDVGPTLFDRILAVNAFGTKTVLFIAIIVFIKRRPDFLDLALLYSLMSFIGTVAVLRFAKFGHFDEVPTNEGTTSASSEGAS